MLAKEEKRTRRHNRIRKRMTGTQDRPRLTVHRSLNHIYVQLIDDLAEKTLFSFSSRDKAFKRPNKVTKSQVSEKLGEQFASKLKEKGITKIAFDRGGYLYHGRVKALAESLRKGGIDF